MQKLPIQCLLISLLFGLFHSCQTYTVAQSSLVPDFKETQVQNPYFADSKKDYVYKASIDIYGHNLGGLFVAKQLNDTLHRVALTTDFGNKLIDFEISENSFTVNEVVDDLNRKIVLNLLEKDFRLLLKKDFNVSEKLENKDYSIYKSSENKRNNYLFFEKNNHKLQKIVQATKRKEIMSLEFVSKNTTFADTITIVHQNIKLNIKLNSIN